MAGAKTEEGRLVEDGRLASVSVSVDGASPGALLRRGGATVRGFWAREGRWFAHLGATAVVRLTTPCAGEDRFQVVWERAVRLLSRAWTDPSSPVASPPPRLFGGFSFREDHVPENGWDGFPLAYFVLPEIELMGVAERGSFGGGVGDSSVLTLRQMVSPEEDPAASRERLYARLHQVRDDLMGFAVGEAPLEAWVPATRPGTDRASWVRAVERALARIEKGAVSKVVLAREQTVVAEGGLDPVRVALHLWREDPDSHVFLLEPEPGHALVGAAPETIASVQGGAFHATAVAGSIARGRTEKERGALARALLESSKDRREHRLCVEDLVGRLGDRAGAVRVDEEPHVLTLSAIQHLETAIDATLKPGETALSVLGALHPTPAVCGLPRDRALAFLRQEEPFQRGWYAGPVGWFDGEGNGVFVPALRCAVGDGGEWRLFAGAGIVLGSDPVQEWYETRIKFQPVLRALSPVGRSGSATKRAAAS